MISIIVALISLAGVIASAILTRIALKNRARYEDIIDLEKRLKEAKERILSLEETLGLYKTRIMELETKNLALMEYMLKSIDKKGRSKI